LIPNILFEKCIYILALEMASGVPVVSAQSFPIAFAFCLLLCYTSEIFLIDSCQMMSRVIVCMFVEFV